MIKPEKDLELPKDSVTEDNPIDMKQLGEEMIRLYHVALAHGIRTMIYTPDATIVMTPKKKVNENN